MSWLELDDRILEHPKFIRAIKLAGSEAVHLWLGVRAYCGQNLTDGFVPEDMLDEVRGPNDPKKRAKALGALRTVGLLDEAEGGVQMHDYLDWSSSREDVLARRESARQRKRRSRGAVSPSEHETDTGDPKMSRRDVARTDGGVRRESQTPARAFPLPSPPHPTNPDLTAAADPRPVSLPRAPAPEAAAAAAVIGQPSKNSGELPPKPPGLPIGAGDPVERHRELTQVRERLPGNLDEALRVPVCARAKLVTSGRVAAQWVQPERWPEVVEVAAALAEGEGRQPLPLGRYDHDAGVRAVVELYAAGFVPGDVKRVARRVPTQAWWTAGDRKRGLANLSPEVMRRGLDETPSDGGLLAAADRAREARLRRSEPESGPMPVAELVASFARGAS